MDVGDRWTGVGGRESEDREQRTEGLCPRSPPTGHLRRSFVLLSPRMGGFRLALGGSQISLYDVRSTKKKFAVANSVNPAILRAGPVSPWETGFPGITNARRPSLLCVAKVSGFPGRRFTELKWIVSPNC